MTIGREVTMDPHREIRMRDLAARQHGVVSRAQLLATGLSPSAIGRRLRSGAFRPLHAGVYLVGPIKPPRALEMAAVLAGGPDAVLSHIDALRLWGLSRATPTEWIHVTVAGSGRGGRPGIRFHRVVCLADDERSTADGVPVTSPGRTLVDSAGLLGLREIERALARAEREGLVPLSELSALPRRYAGRPGIGILRAIVDSEHGPDLPRSEAEHRCIELLVRAGLPKPHVNVPIGPYEIDLLWPDVGVAIEVDGRAYHSRSPRFDGDRRKDRWLATHGIQVIRLTWRHITRDSVQTVAEVARILAMAELQRRPRITPEAGRARP